MRKRSLHVAAGSVAILALSASLAVAVSTPVSFLDSSGNTKDVLPVQLDMGQPIIREADPHAQDMGPQSWVPQVDVRVDGFVPEGYDYGDATKSNQLMQDLGINAAVPSQQPGVVGQSAGGADSQTRPSTTVTVVIGDNGQDAASDSEGATDGYDTSYDSGFDNDSQSGGLYHVGSDDDQSSDENKDETESQDTQNVTFEMPDGANYKRDEALITISSDATPEEVEELLKSANGVVSQTVTQDDIDAGYVKVGLEPGTSVEDAVNEVLNSDSTAVSGAQPNYVYHLMNDRGVEGLIEDIEANESMELPRLAGFYEWQQNQQAQPLQAMGEEEEKEEDQSDSDSQSDTVVMGVQSDSESQSDTITMGVQSEGEASDTVQTAGAMVMSTQSEVVYEEQQATPQQVTYVEQEQASVVPEEEPAETEQKAPQANESQDAQQVETESQTNVEELMPETLPEMIAQAEIARYTPNDAMFGEQWGLESIRAPEAWEVTGAASNVYVAVLDNGFNTGHEDLAANLEMGLAYNSFSENKDVSKDTTNVDHGTHVAGIISAVTDNGKGVAGVAYNAKIIPIKVFKNGSATSDSLIKAYKYLDDLKKQGYNVRVANVSLGTYVESFDNNDKALLKIKESFDNGLITVASAGNISDSPSGTLPYREYPGDYPYIVSVINLNKKGSGNNDASGKYSVSRYDGSNYNVRGEGGTDTNAGKNISAPGSSIISPVTSGKYGYMTGTSMASPHVAGVLALELALNPSLSAQDAINNLFQTAHDLGATGWDEGYGWGEVDAYAAVEAVRGQIEEVIDNVVFTASVAENSYEYDGTQKRPPVYVSYQENKDAASRQVDPELYGVTYENNVNAGIATAMVTGRVQVPGVPNPLNFSTNVNFNISQRPLSKATVSGSKYLTFGRDAEVLDGALVHIPTDLTVSDLGKTFANPTNVTVVDAETVTADGGDYDIKATACNKAGTASLDVIAPVSTIGNYTGSQPFTYTINPLSVNDSIVEIKLDQDSSYAYTGSQIKPGVKVIVKVDGESIVMKEGVDYTVQYGANLKGTGTVTITGTGNLVNSTSKSFTIAESMHDVDVVWGDTEFEYDGESHVPTVSITHGDKPLTEGEDYNLAYYHKTADGEYELTDDEPTDAGTYKAVVKGFGKYAGRVEQGFEIKPASIASASLSNTTATFNGKDQKPSVTVKGIGNKTLPASDYTVSYKRDSAETTDFKNAGEIIVSVTGKGNYKGTKAAGTFTISPLSINDSSVKATLTPTSYTYDGTAKAPSVIVKVNDIVVPSDNYTATYSNNTNVGTGKVTLVGEKNLKDTRGDLTFTIEEVTEPTPIKEKDVEWGEDEFVFDNDNQAPVPTIVVDGEELVEGKDYTVAYYRMNAAGGYDSIGSKAPTSVGTYKVVVTGKTDASGGGFDGEIEHTFEIQAASLTSAKLSKTSATYNGLDQRPSVTVYANGKVLTLGDYDVTYRRNGVVTNDVESVGTVSVSVTGKGNYTGTVNAGTFTISPLSVNDRSVAVTLNPTSYTYDGTAKTPSVIVRINGVTVGSDNYTVTYLDNTNVGVGRVRIDCNGNLTGSRETTFAIRQQTTPTTPDTKPADTTPTQTTTPTTRTYDPYVDNLYYYLLMRRAMQQRYWNGYGNYWDPYTYYRQQMLMRLWMSYMLRPYSWYGYAPSQAYQPYYANNYYGQPRVWNSRYNNYALDYSYNGYNPYTYRNYGYRAPYMDVYPVTVRRSNNYYAPIRTVSPFNVDSDLYKVSYEKVSGEYGIDVDPRTGELSVNPYVQPGMYDVGVRVSGLDRMTGRPYTDVMNANVYVR